MSSRQCAPTARRAIVRRFSISAMLGCAFLVPSSTFAQDIGFKPVAIWGVGLGVASTQKVYRDADRDNMAIPLLHFENEHVRFFGTVGEVKLPSLRLSDTQKIKFGLIGRYDGSGYEAKDAWVLDGMSKRKGGVWAGARAEWQTGLVDLHADWTHDVSGNSKGQRFNLAATRTWRPTERVTLTPRIVATWHDSKYVDYYYGVRADEVRTGRSAYLGESGVSSEVGLYGAYRFDKHHSVVFDLQATRLSSKVKNSPLVDGSTENRVFLGYMYHF
ncbi:MipA/OmpV family protein [Oxalicibacterium flavum]|nr:MipA/OmpV family protein [Oxalicibacterium flavum]